MVGSPFGPSFDTSILSPDQEGHIRRLERQEIELPLAERMMHRPSHGLLPYQTASRTDVEHVPDEAKVGHTDRFSSSRRLVAGDPDGLQNSRVTKGRSTQSQTAVKGDLSPAETQMGLIRPSDVGSQSAVCNFYNWPSGFFHFCQ